MSESKNLELGNFYDRQEISEMLGGNYQHYLPHTNGDVVCGCFDPVKNPNAPKEVLVGKSRDIEKYAKRIVEQNSPISVFIKRGSKQFEFIGNYLAKRYSDDPEEVSRKNNNVRDADKIAGVLYFEEAKSV